MITQRALAETCRVSQPAVFEWLRAMHISHRLDDETAMMVLVVDDLRSYGFTGPVAARIVGEMRSYIQYASSNPSHQAWVAFFDFEGKQHCVAAISTTHLAAVMTSNPVCLVLALHELVTRAAERLDELRAKKSQEAA